MTLNWFLGSDPRDELASQVAIRSMLKHARFEGDIKIHLLKDHELRRAGLYWRAYEVRPNGQGVDLIDGKPFSTQFSFTRFCVPELARMMGIHEPVLFTDPDVMWCAPIEDLFAQYKLGKSVMCVPHDHMPKEMTKFDGIMQERYFRKNWSSVMLIHPDLTRACDPQKVNNRPGSWLHALLWAKDDDIGELPFEWNHLVGYDEKKDAKLVHFTLGTPDSPGRENDEHAAEWLSYVKDGEMPMHFKKPWRLEDAPTPWRKQMGGP